jgi:sugar (pentulose or hexulose) kinase
VALPYPVPVLPGAHDTDCGIMGLGALPEQPGVLCNVMGTFDLHAFYANGSGASDVTLRGRLGEYKPILSGYPSLGSSLEWFAKEFSLKNDGGTFSRMLDACRFDAGCPVMMAPLFMEERVAVKGLSLTRGMGDIFCALVEGVTFECADAVRLMDEAMGREQGRGIEAIRASGGASRTDSWLRLRASVFGKPIVKAAHAQAASVGAAIIAGCAVGCYGGYKEAADHMVPPGEVFLPDAGQRQRYLAKEEEYRRFRAAALGW